MNVLNWIYFGVIHLVIRGITELTVTCSSYLNSNRKLTRISKTEI